MGSSADAASITESVAGDRGAHDDLAGKYLAFKLADEEFGLPILQVIEIIGLMEVTKVPRTDAYVRGVINLRGRVIPVADLRVLFGMESVEATEQTVIIVVQLSCGDKEVVIGLLADRVMEVLDIHSGNTEPPPNLGRGTSDAEFIVGVGKVDSRVIFLLEIARILSAEQNETMLAVANNRNAA